MACTEAYKEHIVYSFNAFCKRSESRKVSDRYSYPVSTLFKCYISMGTEIMPHPFEIITWLPASMDVLLLPSRNICLRTR